MLTVENDETECDVSNSPPRSSQWRSNVCNLGPIEGDQRHTQTGDDTEELVDNNVLGSNPANPGEVTEGTEEVAGEDVPDGTAEEHEEEEAFSGDTTSATHTSILLSVEGVEQCASNKRIGPDHRGRGYEEATSDTTDGETNLH